MSMWASTLFRKFVPKIILKLSKTKKKMLGASFVFFVLSFIGRLQKGVINRKPFSQFMLDLRGGKIAALSIGAAGLTASTITGATYTTITSSMLLNTCGPEIIRRLLTDKIPFGTPKPEFRVGPIIMLLLPFIYLAVSLKMMQRQLNPPSGDVGKKQNDSSALCNGPTFDDIAGMDEALTEVREIVDFLNNSEKYCKIGAKIPKGILLIGPSGTGKTLLARSLAQEACVPFYSCSAYFVEILVGRGAARVRDLFQRATDSSGASIVFIDELDALGKARGGLNSNDEREQTLNQLLTEMDGFDTRVDENGNKLDPIVIIAATNRPEVLDPALIRPGRFDRHVEIGLPNVVEKLYFVYIQKI